MKAMRTLVVWLLAAAINTAKSGPVQSHGEVYYLPKDGYQRDNRGLIPFPRVGRSAGTWQLDQDSDNHAENVDSPKKLAADEPSASEQHRFARSVNDPTQAYARRLLRSSPDNTFMRRILRSDPNAVLNRKLLRSDPGSSYFRRLLRSNTYTRRLLRSDPSEVYYRRLLRSLPSDAFRRRLIRSDPLSTYNRRILKRSGAEMEKRQSLIPFPRTGKRSGMSEPEESSPVLQHMELVQPLLDYEDYAEEENGDVSAQMDNIEETQEESD